LSTASSALLRSASSRKRIETPPLGSRAMPEYWIFSLRIRLRRSVT
jgi:hypothetical protein